MRRNLLGEPRLNSYRDKPRGPKKFYYTYKSVGELLGISAAGAKKAFQRAGLSISKLADVAKLIYLRRPNLLGVK
jgi:hypothetical protein